MAVPFDLKSFVEGAGDALIAANPAGSIVLWNLAAERIFGYSENEALRRSLDLIIPERFRQRHWDAYREVMRTGETRYGTRVLRVPATHKDGRALSIAFTVTLMQSEQSSVGTIVAIVRDETERWQEERALRQRVADLEAKSVKTP